MSGEDQPSNGDRERHALFVLFPVADREQIFQDTQNSVLQVTLVVWGKINFITHTVQREQGLVL